MDSEYPQIAIEIIDEIIETCVNGTQPIRNGSETKKSSGNESKCADQYDDQFEAGNSDQEEIVHETEEYQAAEVEVFEQFDALEGNSCQTVDDDVPVTNNVSDQSLDRRNKAEPDGVQKRPVGVDCEFLKNFSMTNYSGLSVTENLSLTADGNYGKYEIRGENFPQKVAEEELILMFSRFGEVCRLTKHFTTGQIYVTFTKADDAERAIRALNTQIIHGNRVEMHKQLPNRRLIVRNVPKSLNRHKLFGLFRPITPDLLSVSVYNDPSCEHLTRGFCYLEYPEHHRAVEAKRILSSVQIFRTLSHSVEWPDRRFEWMETPDTLFISNTRSSTSSADIIRIFSAFGRIVSVGKSGHFVRVQFHKVDDAKRAAVEVDLSLLGNENVQISSYKLAKVESQYQCKVRRPVNEARSWPCNKSDKIPSVKVMPKEEPKIDANVSDTLYINNLSATVSAADLRKIFSPSGNVLDIDVDRTDGWASVHFPNQEQAKRAASTVDKRQLGTNAHISFFNHAVAGNVSEVLHIRNLRSNVMASDLRKLLSVYGKVMEIDRDNDSAIIHFRDAKDAKAAARSVDRQCMGDRVQISFGDKPTNGVEKSGMNGIEEKRTAASQNDIDKKRAASSEKKTERNPPATSPKKTERKPTMTAENGIEKKRAETSQNKIERKRLITSNTLYIYNIYPDMTTRRLRQLFAVYGVVMDVNVYKDYASVQFTNEHDAIRAAHEIHRIHLGPGPGLPDILFFPKNL